jgi:hypothetical protein
MNIVSTVRQAAIEAKRECLGVSHGAISEIAEEPIAKYARGWQRLIQVDLPDCVERGERFKKGIVHA